MTHGIVTGDKLEGLIKIVHAYEYIERQMSKQNPGGPLYSHYFAGYTELRSCLFQKWLQLDYTQMMLGSWDLIHAGGPELDRIFTLPRLERKTLPEDHPDARWDSIRGLWVESDEAFRKRIVETK